MNGESAVWVGAVATLAPVLIALLRHVLRALAGVVRAVRDTVTLRMVLRDAPPRDRAALLAAHRAWKGRSGA